MSIVIKAENLCKTYKIYNKRLDRIKETFLPFNKQYHTPFHALDNINIEIEKGDTVGVVGRNGSGKSTLLQIICGILQPTGGSIEVNGRISALLELGAGFNPEFTGLENVFLNASILGMKKEEIEDCLDDILSFADIGRFIDQPVKTYSSGMYVRLAFAVAINVNPDILIVDEALSVGDTLFQAKCFAKFKEFQDKGITILFVTHSEDLVTRYCESALLLDAGKQILEGKAKTVIDRYNRLLAGEPRINTDNTVKDTEDCSLGINESSRDKWRSLSLNINPKEDRYGNGAAEIVDFGIKVKNDSYNNKLLHGVIYQFWLKVKFNTQLNSPILAFTMKDVKGLKISGTNTLFKNVETGVVNPEEEIRVTFEHKMLLNSGGYMLSFGCAGYEKGNYVVYDRRFDVVTIDVISDKPSVGVVDLDSVVTVEKVSY